MHRIIVRLVAVNMNDCVKRLVNLSVEFHSRLKGDIHAIWLYTDQENGNSICRNSLYFCLHWFQLQINRVKNFRHYGNISCQKFARAKFISEIDIPFEANMQTKRCGQQQVKRTNGRRVKLLAIFHLFYFFVML